MARRSTARRRALQEPETQAPLRRAPQRTASRPSQRSTFRVAQARRDLAGALSDVTYAKPERRPRMVQDQAPARPRSDAAQTATPQKPRQKPDRLGALTMAKRDEHLKCRPTRKDHRRGGAGGSRKFVPWSKHC